MGWVLFLWNGQVGSKVHHLALWGVDWREGGWLVEGAVNETK